MSGECGVDGLSLEEKVGQLLHVGIGNGYGETDAGWPAEETGEVIRDLQPGAVRIYGSHRAGPYAMAEYANRLQEWAAEVDHAIPLLLSADCEYGTVDVVGHGTRAYPSLMGRTVTGDPGLAREVSAAIARDARSMGLSMTHRPVADVHTNPDNPVIGVRSPGTDPATVSRYATAALEGIHDAGALGVAKHFPGHGDTELDSHHDLPHVTDDRERIEEVHLPPFEALIEAGVDCIMTSHVLVDAIDPDRPATLSKPVLSGLLREELGFEGVVVTDAMMMDAVAENYGVGEAAVRAVVAGADLVLTGYVSHEDLRETRDVLLEAVETGDLPESRIDRSVERILALKERVADGRQVDPIEALEVTGSEAHRSLAHEAYERSVTLLADDGLPIREDDAVLLTGVRGVGALEPHFDRAFGPVVTCSLAPNGTRTGDSKPATVPTADALPTVRDLAAGVDRAVVTTYNREGVPDSQRRMVEAVAGEAPTTVVSLGLPNEFPGLPEVGYLATYLQDRLGLPDPVPDAAGRAIVGALREPPAVRESLPIGE
ncbi:glycoside hydrolase family 3 protein [Saliphagus sp. LR7]|uniref:glycoside hydrolase family 3 protein n=1 Tax=Saliphagus sp. LR7 TaxID=2282654 RepID=UPI000DF863B5|nr:glycoside hydrolase family 3 N-terminal domain-containing protein [Saliphagus sp. LR7]